MIRCKRSRTRNAFVVVALSLLAAGCNIHPLPENVSRASTYDIVARVRCEVWEALQEFKALPDARDREHAEHIIKFSAIGFDFIFDITEGNNIKGPDGKPGVGVSYQREAFKGKEKGFFLDLAANAERERKNTRRFRIVEDLEELSKERVDCRGVTTRPNFAYPVTGATGMGEVVKTYIKLEMLTDLKSKELDLVDGVKPLPIGNKSVAFSDVLKFTTKISAGVNPTLTLTTVAGDLRLTNASFFGSAKRDDIHTVIVALASDPKEDLDAVPLRIRQRGKVAIREYRQTQRARGGAGIAVGVRSVRAPGVRDAAAVTRSPRVATALVQTDVDARTNVLLELQRLRDLEDDELEEPRRLGERLLKLLREPD